MNKLFYRGWIIVFLLILTFVITLSIALLHDRADKVEDRVTTVEQSINPS